MFYSQKFEHDKNSYIILCRSYDVWNKIPFLNDSLRHNPMDDALAYLRRENLQSCVISSEVKI